MNVNKTVPSHREQIEFLFQSLARDRDYYNHKSYLVLISALLRVNCIASTIKVPPLANWKALTDGRASRAPARLFRCCDALERANPAIFKDRLATLCTYSPVNDDIKHDGRLVTKILKLWEEADYVSFDDADWQLASELLARQLTGIERDGLSYEAGLIIQRLISSGVCVFLGRLIENPSALREFATARDGELRLIGSDVTGHVRDRAVSELTAWIGGCVVQSLEDCWDVPPLLSVVVCLPNTRGARRTDSETVRGIKILQQGVELAGEAGVVFAVVPDGLLLGDGPEVDFRKMLIEEDLLDVLIILPVSQKVRNATSESLLVLRRGKQPQHKHQVHFVDASSRQSSPASLSWIEVLSETIKLRGADPPTRTGPAYSLVISNDQIKADCAFSLDIVKYIKPRDSSGDPIQKASTSIAAQVARSNCLEVRILELLQRV